MTVEDIINFVAMLTALKNRNGEYVSGVLTQDALIKLIDYRYKYIFSLFAHKYTEIYQNTAYTDLVANQARYIIGGDAEDMYMIEYVALKYNATYTSYKRAKQRQFKQLFEFDTGTRLFTETSPRYIHSPKVDPDDSHENPRKFRGIEVFPTPTTTVSNGLMVRYIEVPRKLETLEDMPIELPSPAHYHIANFVISDVWRARGDTAKSNNELNKAKEELAEFMSSYQPLASDEIFVPETLSNFNPLHRRHG